ncbi:MAG: DUF2079 domain-containing protein, partial [Candidatus Omnitrophota bacterium]
MKKIRPDIFIAVSIAVYILYFCFLSFLKYRSFGYHDYDLSTNAYSIWGVLRGRFYNPIYGGHFLGNHAHFIFFPLAVIHFFFPHPLTLLFIQSFFLGIAAWPLYLIAKEQIGKEYACLIGIMYLLYPALGYTNLFEFHPTVFATAFLLFMFYFFKKKRFMLSLLFALLAIACQENISLIIVAFGLYCLFTSRNFKWGTGLILLGLSWFCICVFALTPYFNKETFQLFNFYSHFGPNIPEAAKNILLHPFSAFKFILDQPLNASYLMSLFAPLAFLPLLGWKELLISLPLFAQHLLSIRLTEHTIYYHYTAEMIPFIFIAAIYGIRKIQSFKSIERNKTVFISIILSIVIISNLILGPQLKLLVNLKPLYRDQRDKIKARFVKMVPKQAAVMATFEFLPHLLYRQNIYSFHNVITGYIPYSDKKFELPIKVKYALIDFMDPLTFSCFYRKKTSDINLKNFFSETKWTILA